jgi:hypothetical protein
VRLLPSIKSLRTGFIGPAVIRDRPPFDEDESYRGRFSFRPGRQLQAIDGDLPPPTLKILLVADDPVSGRILREILRSEPGHAITDATGGDEA